jgi:Anthranilate/para-aminobenzoate synthases component II
MGTRYHSLIVDPNNIPKDLEVTAVTNDNIIMGLSHKTYDVHGIQFHPESIKTNLGKK